MSADLKVALQGGSPFLKVFAGKHRIGTEPGTEFLHGCMDLPFFFQGVPICKKIQLVHAVVSRYVAGADADPPEEKPVIRTRIELFCHQRNNISGNVGAFL